MTRKFIFIIFILLLPQLAGGQEKRLALVIGNENYRNSLPLYNPINDANDMEEALSASGFTVVKLTDMEKEKMVDAIETFGKSLVNFDVGLFFYAGHGVQLDGKNYLIPVDAALRSEDDIPTECVLVQEMLKLMETADNTTNIIILDACRENPFERSWRRSSGSKGLAYIDAPSGSLIAMATRPGRTASDGGGDNGLYTESLLKYIPVSGLKIEDMFKLVRGEVIENSDGEQTPWEYSSLEGNFYFNNGNANDLNAEFPAENISGTENVEIIENIFVDLRDNQEYRYITIDGQVWMTENLNYETNDSWCYGNSSRNCKIYGRLYTWEAAMEACPDGWHLPSDQEWKDLEKYLGMSESEVNSRYYRGSEQAYLLRSSGTDYWLESNLDIVDSLGFSALPGGSREPDASFYFLGQECIFWTATEYAETTAWNRRIRISDPQIFRFHPFKKIGYSIRCLRNQE